MKNILLLVFFLIPSFFVKMEGQSQTDLELVYNVNTCTYEVYAHVLSGNETIWPNQAGALSVGVVIPSLIGDAAITNIVSYEPVGASWSQGSECYNEPTSMLDFYQITQGGGLFTTWETGDIILLFTFQVSVLQCHDGIRLYENEEDPPPAVTCLGNFANSLQMTYAAIFEQLPNGETYHANINNAGIELPKPTPEPSFICEEELISLFANPPIPYPACFGTLLTYSWVCPGPCPEDFIATDENPFFSTAGWTEAQKAAAAGTYTVTVTDGNGCTAEAGILVDETNCIELPIELLSFDAIKSGETAVTSWVTLNEIDNDYFEVERSTDGKDFYTLSEKISGAGTSVDKNSYSWIDVRPAIGINYYRLKQIDFDGGHTYSRVKSLYFDGKDIRMSLYPNPARNAVTLTTGQKKGEVTLLIFDPKGQAVFTEDYEPGDWKTSTQLDIQDMVEGMYMIKLIEGNKTETARFVKVR